PVCSSRIRKKRNYTVAQQRCLFAVSAWRPVVTVTVGTSHLEVFQWTSLYPENPQFPGPHQVLDSQLNFELEMLNMEHKKVMVDLEKFPNEISEALNKCKELTEETVSYSILHSQLLSEWTHLKEKVSILREENRKLRGEQISLQESCEELRRLCGEAHEKIYDLWAN
ncbi:disks large homolog 5-like, partial [Peromyscus californicus insignis]|uniref:disks large homolog 5-like n=1 Tax=Peromyscus californicus insignis TaxID=564181 RepID=UPI0022A763C0